MRALILAFSAFLLFGCNQQQMLEKISTPSDQALAKSYIADLQAGRLDVIESKLDPSLRNPEVRRILVAAAEILPEGPPTSVKLVGAQRFIYPSFTRVTTTFEYQWGDKWFLCNVTIKKSATAQTILGMHVNLQKTSLKAQTKFTLKGKSASQYAILAGAILAFCLTAFALVDCIRMKGIRRKWLWIIFIIVGFGLLSVNWSTGVVSFKLLSVSLFSAGYFAPLYGPWTISMSAPVGAIIFLLRRRKLRSTLQPTAHVG
ncbi:hypothetical protein [Phenylobacterium sp.]|uniref:hypothetical protein n=1 Tax=Phenylobacterium sp. TaxID=1871053 RepID=UPI0025D76F92|nr:hypothetical protein [Phenylobacterium sp.]MCA3714266.1 hypothetical protein [Phenylobacterium sp.]MCA6329225.1 hypothetical protein [Phenylobacterium sp.]